MLPFPSLFPSSLFLLFPIPRGAFALICYSCTTSLSATVEESAQVALRLFLNSVYELPPVHQFCNMEPDVEFKTVSTIQCSTSNDQCVKVRAENDGLEFVLRGCKSKIYKPDVGIPQNIQCQHGSPSLCFCRDNLCNLAKGTETNVVAMIGTVILILLISQNFNDQFTH